MVHGPIQRFFQAAAVGTMTLRAGIVGANFAVMMMLAGVLGLHGFGELAFAWGIALILSTTVSLGGPLIILRQMTDGGGMVPGQIVLIAVVYPFCIAVLFFVPLILLWPDMPWMSLFVVALGVNMLGCLSSVLRGYGSINLSMVLRDAGPQIALALAVITGGAAVLAIAGLLMIATAVVIWARLRHPSAARPTANVDAVSLWGTMVLGIGVAQVDLIIGGLFLPPEALGLYALLRRIANLVAMPVSVATWVCAGPISAASASGDIGQLQKASDAGNRVAILSGLPLFLAGLVGLLFVPTFVAADLVPVTQTVFFILLCGAVLQVWFASGLPVATLSGLAHLAALSRLISLTIYVVVGLVFGIGLTLVTQALAYVIAMSIGSIILWRTLGGKLGVDTSAVALLSGKAARWKLS